MNTRQLTQTWNDWLGASEKLTRLLHEQTVALTLRDLPRIEKLQPELTKRQHELVELDKRAATCAKELAEALGCEPNLRSLVRVLEKAEGQLVQQTANKVTMAARQVEHLLAKNRKLIENELVYINGTLTLIARTAQSEPKPKKYARAAVQTAVLVDQAA